MSQKSLRKFIKWVKRCGIEVSVSDVLPILLQGFRQFLIKTFYSHEIKCQSYQKKVNN